jgi:hypothetical protein
MRWKHRMIHDLNELGRTGRVPNEALTLLESDRKRLEQQHGGPAPSGDGTVGSPLQTLYGTVLLAANTRDHLKWVALAAGYTSLGLGERADHAMEMACRKPVGIPSATNRTARPLGEATARALEPLRDLDDDFFGFRCRATSRLVTGSSLNSAVEVNAVSGGDRVDQGWSSEGGSLSVQARHHRLRVTAGASQERMARKALGQQGCWGRWDGAGPLSPAPGRGTGPARWHQGSGWGEPLVPAEGEGAVDQGLVAADGAGGADLAPLKGRDAPHGRVLRACSRAPVTAKTDPVETRTARSRRRRIR